MLLASLNQRVTNSDITFRSLTSSLLTLVVSLQDCPDGLITPEILKSIYVRFFPCGSESTRFIGLLLLVCMCVGANG